jgi:phosphoserine phosphatase RsbU/P
LRTFKDTTKQDWGIFISGFLALGLFFWLYGEYHPLSSADSSLGEEEATRLASAVFQQTGYQSSREPHTRFRTNPLVADSIQSAVSFNEFYRNEENRRIFPVYYWESSFFIEPLPDWFDFGGPQAKTIRIYHNEFGEMIGLRNEDELLPSGKVNSSALTHALGQTPIIPADIDSTIYQRIQFSFNATETADAEQVIDLSEHHFFGEEIAESIADYYLQKTGWPMDKFVLSRVEKRSFGEVESARLIYNLDESFIPNGISSGPELTISVLPTGSLVSLTYRYFEGAGSGLTVDSVKSNIRGALVLLSIFLVLILLFIRFRMRLIDMKAAVLVAVLAGFIIPFVIVTQTTFNHLRSFGELNLSFFLGTLMMTGIIAAFTSILYFLVTSIADSVTRQEWAEKLRTIDLIRTGHLVNRPVGLTFIRGVSFSFIIAAVFALVTIMLPGSYFSLEQNFFGSSRYLPQVAMILNNLSWFFIIALAIYLIVLGYVRMYTKSAWIPVLCSGLIFALMNPLTVSVGPLKTELIAVGVAGILFGIIYIREDFLTTLIALFFTGGLLLTSSGWLFSPSPDSSVFYTQAVLISGAFIFGSYSIVRGKSISELPEFVPEYIRELAQEERIKQELQIARKVQESFLPDRTPEFPGLDIAAICKPAYETGGDYYDFIELGHKRLALTIGDVSGKGIQAAFYMTFTKGVLHAICEEFRSTTEVLCKTNTLFRRNAKRGTFVSLIFGVIDQENNTFCFSRAGHNPLLYFNSKEGTLHEFTPQGLGLGMAGEKIFGASIQEQCITLNRNDLLIMFTDGIVEATNGSDDFYGDERLQSIIRTHNKLGAKDLMQRILEDLERFSESADQHDDMTMLVIKKQ